MTPRHARRVFAVACALLAGAVATQAMRQDAGVPGAAPRLLSQTGLYFEDGTINPRNRPYSPQYPLWTDGAAKQRWAQLPPGATIDVSDPDHWVFPVGARFWKEFSFNGRRVETRFLWKTGDDQWTFASYAWNDAQTDATLVPEGGQPRAAEVAPGRFHNIPGIAECRSCHDSGRTEVLGFDALQLSDDRDPHALHADAPRPDFTTLRTLLAEDKLAPARTDWLATPPRIGDGSTDARTRTVLGYLSTNCGSCHNRRSSIASLGLFLKHSVSASAAACSGAIDSTVGRRGHWVVPTAPDGESMLIHPGRPEFSALLARMRSRRPSSQMPAIGSAVVDTDAVDLLTEWIRNDVERLTAARPGHDPNRLTSPCSPPGL